MENGTLWLKTLHIVGAVLFLGNIVVTGWWKVMADRTRDPRVIAFAQRQVTLTDWVFTGGGVIWVAILIPVQARLAGLARAFGDGPVPQAYWRLCRVWNFWGIVATLLPFSVLYFMVLKAAA